MKAIREVTDQALRWTQPSVFKRDYELRAGDEVLATLCWQKTFGSLALAEAAGGTWTLKRSGFLQPESNRAGTGVVGDGSGSVPTGLGGRGDAAFVGRTLLSLAQY